MVKTKTKSARASLCDMAINHSLLLDQEMQPLSKCLPDGSHNNIFDLKSSLVYLRSKTGQLLCVAIIWAIIGFIGHLTFDLARFHASLPSADTPFGLAVRRSNLILLYRHSVSEVERFQQFVPEWSVAKNTALILGLLIQSGEAAARTSIILAFFAASSLLVITGSKQRKQNHTSRAQRD